MTEPTEASAASTTGRRQYKAGDTRRQDIMAAVVRLLGAPRIRRFTTKEIAASIGVSEASLYRHFPSKASMLLGIVEFCDQSFLLMSQTVDRLPDRPYLFRVLTKMRAYLDFAEANPGIARMLTAEAIAQEDPRVQESMRAVLARAQNFLKQTLREAALEGELRADTNVTLLASVLMNFIQGAWLRYSMSGFRDRPTESWATEVRWFERLLRSAEP